MKKTISIIMMFSLVFALSIGVFAASNFTPSVTAKPAPQIKNATVVDSNNNVLINVSKGDINVIAYADRNSAEDNYKTNLENAYNQIQKNGVANLTPEVAEHIKNENSNVKPSELVVRDIFAVSLSGDAKTEAEKSGNKITVTFDAKWNKDQYLMVMVNNGDSKWDVISNDDVKINDDGTITVTFKYASTIAFVTDGEKLNIDKDTTSPQTNDITGKIIAVAGLISACAIGAVSFKNKKSK